MKRVKTTFVPRRPRSREFHIDFIMKNCTNSAGSIAEARWPISHNFKNKHDIILLYLRNKI
jgi:hypothetical protein